MTDRSLLWAIVYFMAFKTCLLAFVVHEVSENKELVKQNRATVIDFLSNQKTLEKETASVRLELANARAKIKELESIHKGLELKRRAADGRQ